MTDSIWNHETYDHERRRLIHCFDEFYGTVTELIARFTQNEPRILDLGAGTGILSSMIIDRVPAAHLHLLDISNEMLREAEHRLSRMKPKLFDQSLNDALPSGPFDAVVSALAIHHLTDYEKCVLYRNILNVLAPGGIFINAEQVAGGSDRLQHLLESVHLERARNLGSTESEIAGAMQRMAYDKCATVSEQLRWLTEIGFEDADCLFRSFRFAVLVAWKPAASENLDS